MSKTNNTAVKATTKTKKRPGKPNKKMRDDLGKLTYIILTAKGEI